jgi:hypothetical protein
MNRVKALQTLQVALPDCHTLLQSYAAFQSHASDRDISNFMMIFEVMDKDDKIGALQLFLENPHKCA